MFDESALFVSLVFSMLPKDVRFKKLFIVTAAGVKCRMAALKRLTILHHSANYIFWSMAS